ncbi:hypothetical protein HYPSUDRAFT_768424 [Hypholoma sublateritium FD-334 SS-4]|uniref:Secreted protein n=1 Tax=Hypholoma sublateritium (strain FD-334 SS-4) TaxID=945553 RepID=A0A0D2L2E0_HYPSF|nr:hypothetical protein HYPSUDRAFT_768424 [Hypholoma sublateritium FD-334 SS-4]
MYHILIYLCCCLVLYSPPPVLDPPRNTYARPTPYLLGPHPHFPIAVTRINFKRSNKRWRTFPSPPPSSVTRLDAGPVIPSMPSARISSCLFARLYVLLPQEQCKHYAPIVPEPTLRARAQMAQDVLTLLCYFFYFFIDPGRRTAERQPLDTKPAPRNRKIAPATAAIP